MPGYIETHRSAVRLWECDEMGHLNVMYYMSRMSDAGFYLMVLVGLTRDYMKETGAGMAAVEHVIRYKRELMSGDIVAIESGILDVSAKTLRFYHRMLKLPSGELSATMEGVTVHFDRQARRSTPMPEKMRQLAETYRVVRNET